MRTMGKRSRKKKKREEENNQGKEEEREGGEKNNVERGGEAKAGKKIEKDRCERRF